MNPKLKKNLSFALIVLSIGAVIVIAFSNPELGDAWTAVRRMRLDWGAGILLCWCVYVGFESLGSWLYLRWEHFPIHFGSSLMATLIGYYYSNITPSAAGGQPMQVNALRRAGIPVGYGTMAVTVRLMANQGMVALISLVLLLLHRDFVYAQLQGAIWLVRVGWIINFSAVPLVLLAAFQRRGLQKLVNGIIRLLAKLRLIRNPEQTQVQAMEVLDTYHSALKDVLRSPGQLLVQLGCSLISLLGLFASVVFVYHAFGMTGTSWNRLLTLGALLFVSASYTPLPGASGAQEGGFLLYFRGIFTDGMIGLALLVWRFCTFYLFLLIGVVILPAERLAARKRKTEKA